VARRPASYRLRLTCPGGPSTSPRRSTVAALTRNHDDDDWSETWLLAGFVGPFVPDIPIGQEPF